MPRGEPEPQQLAPFLRAKHCWHNVLTPGDVKFLLEFCVALAKTLSLFKGKLTSPSKQASTEVAKNMVAKYPQSLQDVIEGYVVGPRYHSLVKQLQARIENVKRSSAPRIMKRKRGSDEYDTEKIPAEQRAAVQDTYGYIKWDMKFMPVSETPESQQEKKVCSLSTFILSNFSPAEVKTLMKCTYYSQHKEINKGTDLQSLMEEWPFLFQEIGMTVQELTGVSLKETFLTSVEKRENGFWTS
ncbi:hypothetical protein MATL_G00257680 [Megalops atlanticus]|uniref:Uncharacterized protein n=1 Tax=Megalops atlanticus TaxID=7932 RepID=A0A9D3PAJ4_MEGAT|nr:hypothetical protein MATL_G00257680 [Megalops atlanticus]